MPHVVSHSDSNESRWPEVPQQMLRAGEVWLVGAGPGDPALLTVGGLSALRQADVVVHDRLGCEEVLQLLPSNVRTVSVGKNPGGARTSQETIHEILIAEAREGNRVVRLKGGDPFVFGRGMEEVIALREAGIPTRVIAGISSAVAGPHAAGIPVTHRGVAHGFNVYTGHDSAGNVPPPGTGDTRIFLMGMSHLSEIVANLISEGLDAQTPCAVIENATTYRERIVSSTLETVLADVALAGVGAPAVFLVGETAALSTRTIATQQPAILVTSTRIPAAFEDIFPGRRALWRPVHRIVELRGSDRLSARGAVVESAKCDWVIFSNPHAVSEFMHLLLEAGLDGRALECRVAAIGVEAAAALCDRGIMADRVVVDGRRNGAVGELSDVIGGRRAVLVTGSGYTGSLPGALRIMGALVEVLGVYSNETRVPAPVDWAFISEVWFASPRNVRHFADAFPCAPVQQLTAHTNGESAANEARRLGFTRVVEQGTESARPEKQAI